MASWLLSILPVGMVGTLGRQGWRHCIVFPRFCLILTKQFSSSSPGVVARSNATAAGSVLYRQGVNPDVAALVKLRSTGLSVGRVCEAMPFLSFR